MDYDIRGKEKYRITDSEVLDKFIHGGKGRLVLVNSSDGWGHEYLFQAPENAKDFDEGTIFVYSLHEGKKFYLGMLTDDGDGFKRTKNSKFTEDADVVKGAHFITKMVRKQSQFWKSVMHIYQSGRCCKCGRPLDSEKALATGFGRKCLAKFEMMKAIKKWDGNS